MNYTNLNEYKNDLAVNIKVYLQMSYQISPFSRLDYTDVYTINISCCMTNWQQT